MPSPLKIGSFAEGSFSLGWGLKQQLDAVDPTGKQFSYIFASDFENWPDKMRDVALLQAAGVEIRIPYPKPGQEGAKGLDVGVITAPFSTDLATTQLLCDRMAEGCAKQGLDWIVFGGRHNSTQSPEHWQYGSPELYYGSMRKVYELVAVYEPKDFQSLTLGYKHQFSARGIKDDIWLDGKNFMYAGVWKRRVASAASQKVQSFDELRNLITHAPLVDTPDLDCLQYIRNVGGKQSPASLSKKKALPAKAKKALAKKSGGKAKKPTTKAATKTKPAANTPAAKAAKQSAKAANKMLTAKKAPKASKPKVTKAKKAMKAKKPKASEKAPKASTPKTGGNKK